MSADARRGAWAHLALRDGASAALAGVVRQAIYMAYLMRGGASEEQLDAVHLAVMHGLVSSGGDPRAEPERALVVGLLADAMPDPDPGVCSHSGPCDDRCRRVCPACGHVDGRHCAVCDCGCDGCSDDACTHGLAHWSDE